MCVLISIAPSEKKTKVSMGDKEVGIPFTCITVESRFYDVARDSKIISLNGDLEAKQLKNRIPRYGQ